MVGVPLGRVIDGPGMLCADHISWFERGLVSAPSAMVLGLNGLGKSSLVRRIVLGHAYQGIHSMVLGDIKPDYVDVVRAMGGQVIEIGHGKSGVNPLDPGNVDEAARLLADHPKERAALLAAAHERTKTMVLSLLQIIRRDPPSNREEIIIDEAIAILEDRGGKPVLADLLELIRQAPERLRLAAMDRGSDSRYREITEELEVSLMALLSGRWGGIFAAETTTPMMMDRSVVFDVSALINVSSDLQAAVLLATWSYGFGTVEIAQALADAGVAPRRRYSLIMDELWRIMEASSGMVERIDSLTRLNRTIGIGQMMITHSMADFASLSTEADRTKARGFVERSKMLFLGGLPAREMPLLRGVMPFSDAEQELLSSWNAPATFDAHTGRSGTPIGMGKFLLKTSGAPGIPFQVQFAPAERPVNITSGRWRVSHETRRTAS
ncbi:ATP/GTP-binding protein [Actinomyces succiniciruminis]|uniref:ATP/GTP-binding protein n=2 Tax=Actinomyces succiniciruminis TaxID=1522002 RepID=A0A1L7RHW7_9ACTO|nr:ATP/GTP-binding protein [Actinomyces succiniciruminis]